MLARVRKASHAQSVTIERGGLSATNVSARIGRSEDLRADQSAGLIVAHEVRDFIIAAADYDFGSGPVEPADGDRIIDSSSGTAITYVARPITGQDSARWADRYGTSWRIHTVRDN